MQAGATAGNARRTNCRANRCERWRAYCAAWDVDPLLPGLADPIPFMCTFTYQYRVGTVAARGRPVGARQAEEAIRFVGQTMAHLGVKDKRKTHPPDIDPRLRDMWKQWATEDPPPARVKPVPMRVLFRAQALADADNSLASAATARMMWINMFYLCRPGESCATRYACHFFRMRDVVMIRDSIVLDLLTCSDSALRGASDTHLTFTTQKNKHRNERIGQKASATRRRHRRLPSRGS